MHAEVQVVHDLERLPGTGVGALLNPAFVQQARADPPVQRRAIEVGQQRRRGLLHPVVSEPVARSCGGNHQSLVQCAAQPRPRGARRLASHDVEGVGHEAVAEAGRALQELLGPLGQVAQASHHQIDDVVGASLRGDGSQVPDPAPLLAVQPQQAVPFEISEELKSEEGAACGLRMNQVSQRPAVVLGAAQALRQPPGDVLLGQWREVDPRSWNAGLGEGVDGGGQRVGRAHLVVAAGADDQQVAQVSAGQHGFQQGQ